MASSSRVRLTAVLPSSRPGSARCFSYSTSRPNSNSANHAPHSAAPQEGLTGSDKLLSDALRLEAEEEAALSRQSHRPDPTDPVWTGEERVQDTVLRMVLDKYKPLRIPVDASKNAADEKIKVGIQNPSSPSTSSSPSASTPTSFALFQPPGVAGAHEDGRKLPKTPDEKPWRAVYVRPAHLLGSGAGSGSEETPSIYYGQFLSSDSEVRNKLKKAGVTSVPVDDPKALSALRSTLKTAERRGKLLRARESVLDYQLSSQPCSSSSPDQGGQGGDTLSDTTRNLQLQLGHAQGWDSVIEKRIKAALESGAFRENKLRGKPIQRDMEEKNPFLAREEYFMNRIVKRQGSAPPWVELNSELEREVSSWRARLDDAWVRRAVRMISTSTAVDASQGLVEVVKGYRDPEWFIREKAYHTHEVKRLNDLIRRHNHLAPFTARKGLMVLDAELGLMVQRCVARVEAEVVGALEAKSGDGGRKDGWDKRVRREGVVTYDVWGREVKTGAGGGGREDGARGWLDGWLGGGVSGSDAGGGGGGNQKDGGGNDGGQGEVQSLGLLAAIQKSLSWARQRIVGT